MGGVLIGRIKLKSPYFVAKSSPQVILLCSKEFFQNVMATGEGCEAEPGGLRWASEGQGCWQTPAPGRPTSLVTSQLAFCEARQHLCRCLSLVRCFWPAHPSAAAHPSAPRHPLGQLALASEQTTAVSFFAGRNIILSLLQYPEISGYNDQHQLEFLPD